MATSLEKLPRNFLESYYWIELCERLNLGQVLYFLTYYINVNFARFTAIQSQYLKIILKIFYSIPIGMSLPIESMVTVTNSSFSFFLIF